MLWSPWRYQYVIGEAGAGECFLCEAARDPRRDGESLVVYRGAYTFAILNRFPYTSGHLMLAPYGHIDSLDGLEEAAALEMMSLARSAIKGLRRNYHPEGVNVGINQGKCAGAGVAGHIHMHILPRWTGDTNFMTTTGETRVLPEALEVSYEKALKAFREK